MRFDDPQAQRAPHVDDLLKMIGASYPGFRPSAGRWQAMQREWSAELGDFSPGALSRALLRWRRGDKRQYVPNLGEFAELCRLEERIEKPRPPLELEHQEAPPVFRRRRPADCPYEQLARKWERENAAGPPAEGLREEGARRAREMSALLERKPIGQGGGSTVDDDEAEDAA